MKKIILGIAFSFVFLTSSAFAVSSSNVLSSSEVKTYESLLSTIKTLSSEVGNMKLAGKLTVAQEQSFQTVLLNLMSNILARLGSHSVSTSSTNSSDPVITSIDKTSGPVGTTVTLKGKNLAGFEGDFDAWIENSAGEKAFLRGIYTGPVTEQQIKVQITEKVCKQNTGYSGLPCTSYLNITPGIYKLYTSPWGKKSNVVTFEVIESALGNIEISILNGGVFDTTLLSPVDVDVYLKGKKVYSKNSVNGIVGFTDLVSGTYDIYFRAKDFKDFKKSFFIQKGVNYLAVSLEPSLAFVQKPVISSIQSVTNFVGNIDANKKAFIYGSGLKGQVTITLGMKEPQIIKVENKSDSSLEFTVPDRILSSVVSVSVTNSNGVTSNYYEVKINK